MLRSARWSQRPRACAPVGSAHRLIKCLGALAAGVVALLAAAHEAHATCGGRNFVDRMSVFVSGTVRATSSNGKTYDNIRAGSFDADYRINLCGDGALHGVIVHLGQCTGRRRGCDDNPIMYQEFPSARSLAKKTPTFTFAPPPDSVAGQSILNTCNAHADEQKGAASDKVIFPGFFSVTLGVTTSYDPGRLGGGSNAGYVAVGPVGIASQRPLADYSKTEPGTLTLKILCAPLPIIEETKAPPKIAEAALGVATAGDSCPKPATATVTIAAEAPRPVFYKIERGNGTTTTADWIEGRIKLQKGLMGAKSAFLHTQHDIGALDPGTRKFRLWIDGWGKTPWQTVKVDCPPFKVTSAWLKYDVEKTGTCPKKVAEIATFKATRPGKAPFAIKTAAGLIVHSGIAVFEREGMGYVAKVKRPNLTMGAFDADMMALIKTQPDANSGWVRLKVDCLEALSGKVWLRSLGATACRGEALVAIHTDGAGALPYELECGPGRSWQRSVTAPANKIGVDKMQFDAANNERVTCVLRTRIAGKLKPLDGASMTFQCHRPSDASAADDLVPETRPDPKGPRPPRILIDPPRPPKGDPSGKVIVDPPRLSCAGGVVRAGRCLCPRTHKAVHAGNNAWRCVRSVTIDPPRKLQVKGARSQKATKAAAKGAKKALRQGKGRKPVP
jgi:hypothetical protein